MPRPRARMPGGRAGAGPPARRAGRPRRGADARRDPRLVVPPAADHAAHPGRRARRDHLGARVRRPRRRPNGEGAYAADPAVARPDRDGGRRSRRAHRRRPGHGRRRQRRRRDPHRAPRRRRRRRRSRSRSPTAPRPTATITSQDEENDIAVAPARQRCPPLIVPAVLGNPAALRIGSEAYVVGNPFGLYGSMSTGVVSGPRALVPRPRDRRSCIPASSRSTPP